MKPLCRSFFLCRPTSLHVRCPSASVFFSAPTIVTTTRWVSHPTHPSSASSTVHDGDDDERLNIYNPNLHDTDEVKEKKQKTELFIRLLLTTTQEEQLWRDMLSAALRLGTWKEHHLWRVLRGVKNPTYDGAAVEGRGTSHPTQRLKRAREIVQYTVEEGLAEAMRQQDADPPVTVYHEPDSSLLHHLLVLHLEAVRTTAATTVTTDAPSTTPEEVWSLLSWMELHGYHIESVKLLEELEEMLRNASGQLSAAQKMNRVDYLNAERKRLLDPTDPSKKRRKEASVSPQVEAK